MRLVIVCSLMFLSACSVSAKPAEPQRKQLVCVDEVSCKATLAEDCKRGGVLHGVVPAIIVDYTCNP
jgi:hypothetical protein